MNRAAALAEIAAASMKAGVLFQYIPGESLVTSIRLGDAEIVEWDGVRFDACRFVSVDGNPPGWGYMVDERS